GPPVAAGVPAPRALDGLEADPPSVAARPAGAASAPRSASPATVHDGEDARELLEEEASSRSGLAVVAARSGAALAAGAARAPPRRSWPAAAARSAGPAGGSPPHGR